MGQEQHPICNLMTTAMQSIRDMVDVNTIVGEPVSTPDGSVIIPISKVSFGFAAGGGEYGGNVDFSKTDVTLCECENIDDEECECMDASLVTPVKYPFAGGSGAGVSITPVGFLVVSNGIVQMLPVDSNTAMEKIIDMIPGAINKVFDMVSNTIKNKEEVEEVHFDTTD